MCTTRRSIRERDEGRNPRTVNEESYIKGQKEVPLVGSQKQKLISCLRHFCLNNFMVKIDKKITKC